MCSQAGIWRFGEAWSALGSARIQRLLGAGWDLWVKSNPHGCQGPLFGAGAVIVAANGRVVMDHLLFVKQQRSLLAQRSANAHANASRRPYKRLH